jgi:hypothetical protein
MGERGYAIFGLGVELKERFGRLGFGICWIVLR